MSETEKIRELNDARRRAPAASGRCSWLSQQMRGPAVKQGPSTARAVPGLRPNRISTDWSLYGFPMQCEIEAIALDLLGHAQADYNIDDFENDQCHDRVIDDDGADADRLIDDLHEIAFEQARGAA